MRQVPAEVRGFVRGERGFERGTVLEHHTAEGGPVLILGIKRIIWFFQKNSHSNVSLPALDLA